MVLNDKSKSAAKNCEHDYIKLAMWLYYCSKSAKMIIPNIWFETINFAKHTNEKFQHHNFAACRFQQFQLLMCKDDNLIANSMNTQVSAFYQNNKPENSS